MKIITFLLLGAWASIAQSADIIVNVTGAPEGEVLVFQVYSSANAFGDFRDPAKEVQFPVQPSGEYEINDVPIGDVAILVYVDENQNGLIDKNFIGIPKEALGISNNYRPKGPPTFDRAKFTVVEGQITRINIDIYKVLGERGRLGMGVGVIARSSPYTGSNATVAQPIPAITYNGERLQWLGPNVQYGILGTGALRLAASASYRVGVYEEDDSPALAGLGDRSATLMGGLGLRAEIPGGINMSIRYEHDILDKIGGGAGTASLSKGFQAGWLRIAPQIQINWLSSDLSNYDFGVPENAATPTRPAYSTGSTVSYQLGFTSFVELTEEWRIILSVANEFLPDKVVNSPIVENDRVVKGFAAITYVF